MIVTSLNSGLGNQLFQYAFGRALALHHGVDLKLNLYWYKSEVNSSFRAYELDKFKIEAPEADWKELDDYILRDTRWHRLFKPYYKRLRVYEKGHRYDENMFRSNPHTYFDGYWQSWKYFDKYKTVLLKEFQLKEPAKSTSLEWLDKMKSSESVAIHIRRGDYVANASFNVLPMDYYHRAIEQMKVALNDTQQWFVFSDDIEWAEANLTFLKSPMFVKGLSTLEDFRLMNACKHNIIANSSYSWWAAWLKDLSVSKVFAPKQPFTNSDLYQAEDYYPKEFMLV